MHESIGSLALNGLMWNEVQKSQSVFCGTDLCYQDPIFWEGLKVCQPNGSSLVKLLSIFFYLYGRSL